MQFLYTENVNGKKTTGVLGEGSIRHRLNPHDAVDSHVRRWAEVVNEVVSTIDAPTTRDCNATAKVLIYGPRGSTVPSATSR